MIIDIHAHAFPDELAERALAALNHRNSVPPCTDGTVAGLSESTRRAGIDISVNMPIATRPSQSRSINEWSADAVSRVDNVMSFGTLHPLQEDLRGEIERLTSAGFLGIKLHPDYQEFFVDQPELTPMYQAVADAGLILLFHAGVDIGLPPPVHCTPDRLARVLDRVPTLTVIAAHMGSYLCWDDVERYLVGREVYFDTSYSLTDMGPERMAAIIRAHGADKVLFGTDSPWTDQTLEVEGIKALPLSPDEIAAVIGGNAARLLGL